MSAKDKYEFHLQNWSDIQDHLPRLFSAAKGNVLEIGVRSGVSTSALLAGIEEKFGHLYSVDIDHCEVFLGHPRWTFYKADSIKQAEFLQAILPDKLDVLFVDGDHTYFGALSDLMKFGPRAETIFVHDTDAPNFPGVRQAVEDFAKGTNRTVTYHSGSYGLAEIH